MADTNYDEKLSIAVDNIPVIYVKNKDCKDKLVVNKSVEWGENVGESSKKVHTTTRCGEERHNCPNEKDVYSLAT